MLKPFTDVNVYTIVIEINNNTVYIANITHHLNTIN